MTQHLVLSLRSGLIALGTRYRGRPDRRTPIAETRMVQTKNFKTIDEYVETFPEDVQSILGKLRVTVKKAAPEAVESISYQMPTFKLDKQRLVYFSAWKNHIGFYSIPEGDETFRKELSPYSGEKGSLRFPLDKPIPYDLVKKVVVLRVKEIREKRK